MRQPTVPRSSTYEHQSKQRIGHRYDQQLAFHAMQGISDYLAYLSANMSHNTITTQHDAARADAVRRSLLKKPIAHRGLHSDVIPENSLAAFRWAINCNLTIELDVQLLADGQAVVFHDSNTDRLTGESRTIKNLTASEARSMPLLGTSETLPLLEDVIDLVQGSVPLLIELKSGGVDAGKLEEIVIDKLAHYNGDYCIQSFEFKSVLWLRKNAPHILRGQLSSRQDGVPFHRFTQPDFVAYELHSLPHAAATRLRDQGIPLLAWTISNRAEQALAGTVADNYIFNQDADIMQSLGLPAREPG